MDAHDIDIGLLGISPNSYDVDGDLASKVISVQNESLAAVLRGAHRSLRGVHVGRAPAPRSRGAPARRGHEEAGTARSRNRLQRRRAPSSPMRSSSRSGQRPRSLGRWSSSIRRRPAPAALNESTQGQRPAGQCDRNPLETTIALSHLIFEGTLDRFPGLKICAAHGGGYLPSYMSRSDHGCHDVPGAVHAGRAEAAPDGVREADVLRFARVHAGSAAAPGRRSRRRATS